MNLRELWIDAAKRLAVDPTAKVLCPKCKFYMLDVRDEEVSESHIERVLTCPECNVSEAIYMKKR